MRIGSHKAFLALEKTDPADQLAPLLIEARLEDRPAAFAGKNPAVYFDRSPEVIAAFDEFAALKSARVVLPMTEGCQIALGRDSHGNIDVDFTIERWHPTLVHLAGRVRVDGDATFDFLRELRHLLVEVVKQAVDPADPAAGAS
jgi:hypothetical protein